MVSWIRWKVSLSFYRPKDYAADSGHVRGRRYAGTVSTPSDSAHGPAPEDGHAPDNVPDADGRMPDAAPRAPEGPSAPVNSAAADTDPPRRGRLATKVLAGGEEPDPRFSLANERTFLAWIRTALALLAGGIAVEAFTTEIFVPVVRKLVAVLLLLLAMVVGVIAAIRWLRVERAMRAKTPLPLTLLVPVLALGGAVVAAILVVFVVVRPS